MFETADDLARLQGLLDESYAAGGAHLKSIITPDRRLSAGEVADRLQGMCLLVLATVTRDGRPRVGPVDSIFYRGAFYFGSSPDSVRWRHLTARPQVSATHVPREELAVTVHGTASPIDVRGEDSGGFRAALLGVYVPKYGPGWEEEFLDSVPVYARLDAERMFTLHLRES
jgi:nitroimidazol reductase NimA-like FMN-containing flavoprotein (pyridoxamine 5'-phosphate oxidase superfamily)